MSKIDVTTGFDIHIGLRPEDIDFFRDRAKEVSGEVYVDGDGWEVWGDKIGQNGNDDIAHVICRTADADEAILLAHNFSIRYLPILKSMHLQSSEVNNGLIVAVTRAEDWADMLLSIDCREDGTRQARYHALTVPLKY